MLTDKLDQAIRFLLKVIKLALS